MAGEDLQNSKNVTLSYSNAGRRCICAQQKVGPVKHDISRRFTVAALSGILFVAGCSHSSNSVMPAAPQQPGSVPNNVTTSGVIPDTCNKNVIETIIDAGGTFKIPACAGTTAAITYGSNNAPSGSTATFLSSATNPNQSACGKPSGETVDAYFTAQLKSSAAFVTFGTTTKKSHIGNPAFMPSQTFTIFAYAFGSQQFSFSLGHPNSLGQLRFASPLNSRSIPQGSLFCFELGTP